MDSMSALVGYFANLSSLKSHLFLFDDLHLPQVMLLCDALRHVPLPNAVGEGVVDAHGRKVDAALVAAVLGAGTVGLDAVGAEALAGGRVDRGLLLVIVVRGGVIVVGAAAAATAAAALLAAGRWDRSVGWLALEIIKKKRSEL